jgi:acetyl-CoA C-acetyltransferase
MSKLRDVVIVSACRTAIGSYGGSLKPVMGCHLGATVIKEAVKRANIDPELIGDVRFGCCVAHHDAMNVARVASLLAGLPVTVPGVSMNRVCVSAMEAVHSSVYQIQSGFSDVCVAGGCESMSNAPYVIPGARWGQRLQDDKCVDAMIHGLMVGSAYVPYPVDGPVGMMRGKPYIMGLTAEFLAAKHKISREEQDEIALRSHNNAERATLTGTFKAEIVPVEIVNKKKTTIVDKDEHFRPGLTLAAISKLPAAFIPSVGTVTAANSSGINDGAAALVLMAADTAAKYNIKPLAVISAMGKGGCAPELMGESPVPAIHDMLKKNGRKVSDYNRIEINEAFAAQYIACERLLNLNRDVTNVNGSGIGLGHPVGCTGARIVVSLLYEMMASKSKLGMATLCGGGGVSLVTELTLC